jgi:Flp pilus assembly CpaE family ATPase
VGGPLIAVWSPKGGVGKTLIAAGLAMHLARRCPEAPILVDLDAGKADIAPLLQIPLRPSVLEYPSQQETVNHPGGLRVLPGPARLIDEGLVTGSLAQSVLAMATEGGHPVVADLSSALRDATVVALERADVVLVVTTPDLLPVYACRRFVQEAEMIDLNPARFRLVINRTTVNQPFPDQEIRELIGLPVAGRISSIPGLAAAVNQGMTSATMRVGTDFARALKGLADNLAFVGIPADRSMPPMDPRPAGLLPALKRWWQRS